MLWAQDSRISLRKGGKQILKHAHECKRYCLCGHSTRVGSEALKEDWQRASSPIEAMARRIAHVALMGEE